MNRKAIARIKVEERVLDALGRRLIEPELFAIFCEEFTAEMNRLRRAAGDQRDDQEKALNKVERDLEKLVQALIDGVPAAAVKSKMEALEAQKAEIEEALAVGPDSKPILHPSMADVYRRKVESLANALNALDQRAEAAEVLRGLVDTIVLQPHADSYEILLNGDLAGILALATASRNGKTAMDGGPTTVSQISLVAGARCQRCLSLPKCILDPREQSSRYILT